jgi:hypothetical protein
MFGFFLGEDLLAGLDQIEKILSGNAKPNRPRIASADYIAAYQAYLSKRGQIELTIKEWLEHLTISSENIKTGMDFLGDNISAALQLGDLSYASTEIDWLRTLLRSYDTPPQQLIAFMETYSHAVNQNINGQGKPIFEWLAKEVQRLKTP